jgi:hypothetical protein
MMACSDQPLAHRWQGGSMPKDFEFYRRRALEERLAMAEAHTQEARDLHRILAEEYEARVRALAGNGTTPEMDEAG